MQKHKLLPSHKAHETMA